MSDSAVSHAGSCARAKSRTRGLPNYFDDQRFGSVGDAAGVRREGDGVRPVRAGAVARAGGPLRVRPRRREAREGDAPRAAGATGRRSRRSCRKGHARSLVDYLVDHPTDFKGAVARLRPELAGAVPLGVPELPVEPDARGVADATRSAPANLAEVELKLGRVPVPVRVPDEKRAAWESLALPLPSARVKPEPDAPWLPIVEEVLQAEGLTLAELKIKGMQKPFFSKGDRAGCVRPANLVARRRGRRAEHGQAEADAAVRPARAAATRRCS